MEWKLSLYQLSFRPMSAVYQQINLFKFCRNISGFCYYDVFLLKTLSILYSTQQSPKEINLKKRDCHKKKIESILTRDCYIFYSNPYMQICIITDFFPNRFTVRTLKKTALEEKYLAQLVML